MTKQITFFILKLLFFSAANAQDFDVRKFTLKSDVILLYDQDSIAYVDEVINDHTTTYYYQLKAVTQIIKNTVGFKFASNKLYYLVENEDYFKISEKGNCDMLGKIVDEVKRKYYGMLFLKKNGKQFSVIGTIINDDLLSDWEPLIRKIKTVNTLEKTTNLQERYTKTIDWFLDNNVLPDENFIEYYKQKGIIKTDTVVLNDTQLAIAKTKFFNGNEVFLDFVGKAYPNEVREYYFRVLESIVSKSEYEYSDCRRFQQVADMLTNDFNDNYNDINRVLTDLLTEELAHYEKEPIMKHIIDVIEKNSYKTGTFSSSKL